MTPFPSVCPLTDTRELREKEHNVTGRTGSGDVCSPTRILATPYVETRPEITVKHNLLNLPASTFTRPQKPQLINHYHLKLKPVYLHHRYTTMKIIGFNITCCKSVTLEAIAFRQGPHTGQTANYQKYYICIHTLYYSIIPICITRITKTKQVLLLFLIFLQ